MEGLIKKVSLAVCMGVCFLTGADAQKVVLDKKVTEMVNLNTAAAMVPETLYRQQNDSVKNNTNLILTAVTLRNTVMTLDMQARTNMKGFRKESRAFARLVYEVHAFVNAAVNVVTEGSKNPHHSVFITKQTTKLILEAKNMVKYAVVVAMKGQVPNPFKLNPDSLAKDLQKVPAYIYDAENDSVWVDKLNLLLPNDRMAIINETRRRLSKIRRAMELMYWKLKTDFNVRNLIWTASRVDGRLYDRNIMVVNQLKRNIEKADGLW